MSNEVLKYIGFDIDKKYDNLKCTKPEFNITKSYDNYMLYKVYKYIPIKDLEILISNTDRTTEIKDRYETSKTIDEYIEEDRNDFLDLADQAKIKEIEEIENMQNEFEKHIPYFVKYEKNYLWQIYYSQESKKYFMLFPGRDRETSVLFYLLKEKLSNSDKKIFVPICKEDYSDKILERSEITDIENYIWLFTKEWPKIYEVEDKLYITGKTKVQDGFESRYRIELNSKEEADVEYTILKALFILQTETTYRFNPCIDEKGKLSFEYDNEIITIDNLSKFITEQVKKQISETSLLEEEVKSSKVELEKIRQQNKELTDVYTSEEKQIVLFLNCKKSFFKKLKFFFKKPEKGTRFSKKTDVKTVEKENKKEEKSKEEKEEKHINSTYNLSDLVKICKENKKYEESIKSIKADFVAAKNKKKNLEKRVENAKKYLDEIESHKKSLFEFWKFAKKDDNLALYEAEEKVDERKIEFSFNIDEDMPEFAVKADKLQKQKLSIDEENSIFACKYVLKSINSVLLGKDEDEILKKELDELKKKYTGNRRTEIFGEIEEDYTKIKNLNNKKHRENKKNIYSILRINETTTLEDYKNTIENLVKLLNEAYKKITSIAEYPIYYTEKLDDQYTIAEIDPKKINLKENEDKTVYKQTLNRDAHVLYFSNIVFYDNYNKTLPDGMDESTSVLVKLEKKKQERTDKVNIVEEDGLFNIKIHKMKVIECYD